MLPVDTVRQELYYLFSRDYLKKKKREQYLYFFYFFLIEFIIFGISYPLQSVIPFLTNSHFMWFRCVFLGLILLTCVILSASIYALQRSYSRYVENYTPENVTTPEHFSNLYMLAEVNQLLQQLDTSSRIDIHAIDTKFVGDNLEIIYQYEDDLRTLSTDTYSVLIDGTQTRVLAYLMPYDLIYGYFKGDIHNITLMNTTISAESEVLSTETELPIPYLN